MSSLLKRTCCPEHRGEQFESIQSFCDAHPQYREKWIAEQVGIDPARFSKLKSQKYGLRPSDAEVHVLAQLLKQTDQHVREQFTEAA